MPVTQGSWFNVGLFANVYLQLLSLLGKCAREVKPCPACRPRLLTRDSEASQKGMQDGVPWGPTSTKLGSPAKVFIIEIKKQTPGQMAESWDLVCGSETLASRSAEALLSCLPRVGKGICPLGAGFLNPHKCQSGA